MLAEGYSYREIGELTGFSTTKVNRCVAEGRERFRRFLVRREGGARCNELAPLLSAFADDEAGPADVAVLREHLGTCPHCRATLRAYRAAPRAAAALAPVLPLPRGSLVDRLHDAYAALATRVGGGAGASDSTLGGLAASGGSRGAGMAALAKVLAVCAGTVGGAACVATGVIPAPLIGSPDHSAARPAAKVSHHPRRHRAEDLEAHGPVYEPTPVEAETQAEPDPRPQESSSSSGGGDQKPKDEAKGRAPEGAAEPTSENGATEYVEPEPTPAPVEASAPTSSNSAGASSSPPASTSSGTAAGEFGP